MPGKTRTQDWSKSEPLNNTLLNKGVQVEPFYWSGKPLDLFKAANNFTEFFKDKINYAVRHNISTVEINTHSLGIPLIEVLVINTSNVKEAFRVAQENGIKINIVCMGSPDPMFNLCKLENQYRGTVTISNYWSPRDFISQVARIPTLASLLTPGGKDFSVPNITHEEWFKYSQVKSAQEVSNHNLYMPQLYVMLKQSDPLTWKYVPSSGSWPGVYNFSSSASLNYPSQQILSPQPVISSQIDYTLNNLSEVNKWYMNAIPPGGTGFNPAYMSTPPLGSTPLVPNFEPVPSMPVYTQQPVYTPQSGSWPGQYNFNIRAPDNYYLNQQQPIAPQTPIMPSAPVIPPTNYQPGR